MKFFRLLGLLAFGSWSVFGAEEVPIEDFARPAAFSRMQLSPDGKYIAFLRENDGHDALFFADLEKMKALRIDAPASAFGGQQSVHSFRWIGNQRVIFQTTIWDQYLTGVSAVDRDGRRLVAFSGMDRKMQDPLWATSMIHAFRETNEFILMLDRNFSHSDDKFYPDVIKVSTLTGSFRTAVKNPGNVVAWLCDQDGVIRVGVTNEGVLSELMSEETKNGFVYRGKEDDAWRPLPALPEERGRVRVLGFGRFDQKFYIAGLSTTKRWAIYPFDLTTGSLGEALAEDADYDIVPALSSAGRTIFSEKKKAFAGVAYFTEGPRMKWFDPEFAAWQKAIDAALPKTVNHVMSLSADDKHLLVLASSAQDPGTYYLFDSGKGALRRLAARKPWIKAAQMASMYPIKYSARDGETIHGYLTLPRERAKKNLPLVVMPHGGPFVRDVWGYEPLVQMLANRGYAVLQMNYRGSPGYGDTFYQKGRHQIGRGMQDDIEDGTRWAIAKGLADPQRVAIVGGSYGGYSALFALGHNPELYRCGISIAGVTDWLGILKKKDEDNKFAYQFWVTHIGDRKNDEAFLRSVSPVNFADRITAPLLIIQGKEDQTVPPKQAQLMIAALEKAGRKPQSLFIPNEGHGFTREKSRVEKFKTIEAFLAKHLGPGAPVLEPEKTASQ